MLKRLCFLAYTHQDEKTKLCLKALNRQIHSNQPHCSARSFFGVEDFLDDDNSRPYTYHIPEGTPKITYLEGFPKPDPKHAEIITAIPRAISGKNISAKERKAGRVPSIVFEQEDGQHGGNKRIISVQNNQIKKLVNHLGRSYFMSRLFELEVRPDVDSEDIIEKVRVLPRLLHLHASTDAVLNVTFIRAPPNALLKVDVPLVFIGDDVSPGLKKGSYLNIIKRTAKFICPADIIPPFIEVDLSELDAGQKLVMGDLKVHPALKLARPRDEPVCKVAGARVSEQKKSK